MSDIEHRGTSRQDSGGSRRTEAVRVFIDGQAGTTGLRIRELIASHANLELIEIPDRSRKDPAAKDRFINEADIVILCLPDDAAREALTMIRNERVRVLDASSAHRTASKWVYGLPELCPKQRERIRQGSRISNPGCYPTGFILMIRPLVDAGFLPAGAALSCHAISGFSGGGRQLIERYEDRSAQALDSSKPSNRLDRLWPVRPYALHLDHKHLPEMALHAGLEAPPIFSPMVGHFAQGMLTMIPLSAGMLAGRAKDEGAARVHACLEARYRNEPCIRVRPLGGEAYLQDGFLDPRLDGHVDGHADEQGKGGNSIELFVFGNDTRIMLVARLDNLGKGAAGAAVQNLNLMIGAGEFEGIDL
ncbi:N-acetyl-gamma-glutamyl-phosphate reductase [Thioalkalivibrio sp. HK1]|uniref:N-acetyl-gamma-glutamyl-phosphate reductase n=1 Tax=Thioalkalivibrio sp. HK1 TaxID=1469245 RepID=UPI0004701884|nr:N-acetyl-gamma-glutamyl-phosphate reductase [Thioalkalivibrio sp. HK1]